MEQVKVWALREAWREEGNGAYGMHTFIASRVRKNRGGKHVGAHPTNVAVKRLLERIDGDDDWFLGKQYGARRGRKRVLVGVKAVALCKSAKAIKASGGEELRLVPSLNATAPWLDGLARMLGERLGRG